MVCPLATLDIHVGTMCTVSPEMITRSGNTVCISTSTHNIYGSPAVFVLLNPVLLDLITQRAPAMDIEALLE